jgi:hypothetical protein
MISGTVFPAFRSFFTFFTVSATSMGFRPNFTPRFCAARCRLVLLGSFANSELYSDLLSGSELPRGMTGGAPEGCREGASLLDFQSAARF